MALEAMCAPLFPKQARQNATQFAEQIMGGQVDLSYQKIDGINNLYIYNIKGGGFIVASSDDRTLPVLGYSRTGRITEQTMNDNLRYWLQEYESQITQLGDATLQQLSANFQPKAPTTLPDSVPMLITSQWTQSGAGYNSMVPADSSLATGHPTVGCGALAAAQIMRYWQYPQHGYGQHSYTYSSYDYPCWRYGTVTADFGNTTYDFAHMPDRLDSSSTSLQVAAVATLLFHCGVALNMNYNSDCYGSSGSTINSAANGLMRYFHYQDDNHIEMMMYHDYNTWIQMLKTDLSQGRPVFYCGQSFENPNEGILGGGHAFVCDGYDANNYFHFNWGWGGYCDGYFALNVLRPMTQYDFTYYQYALFNLHPATHPMAILSMASDLTLSHSTFDQNHPVTGTYTITNLGDSTLNTFVGVNVYGIYDNEYKGCLDGRRVVVEPGDTVVCQFSYDLSLPLGNYMALMQYSPDTFYAGIPNDATLYFDDGDHNNQFNFSITAEQEPLAYKNLVLFLKFADDEEFVNDLSFYERMFNTDAKSVGNYFKAISYNNFTYKTIYPINCVGSRINPYTDSLPRGYFRPYSHDNPIGYTTPNPMISISMREAQLIKRLCHYIDSLHLVPESEVLDADGDGDIDNISIIVSGQTDDWAELLWPHMEFFPHDSIGHTLTINGKRVNCFNFEFDNAPGHTSTRTFCHEMGHSLGLPDLYHYYNYTNVYPVYYDIMGVTLCHPSTIYKHQLLGLGDSPTFITQDGTYTIFSNGSSPNNNLYMIRSALDTNQIFTIEYRNTDDPFEDAIPFSGLIMGRWLDTVTRNIYNAGNSEFDNNLKPHAYWVFRPGSNADITQGSPADCIFSQFSARTTFGPTSNPHPYLIDGTPEQNFEIYDIQENGTTCTFSVRFLHQESISDMPVASAIKAMPNPATSQITLVGVANNTPVSIYNMLGQRVMSLNYVGQPISISDLVSGFYIIHTPQGKIKLLKH